MRYHLESRQFLVFLGCLIGTLQEHLSHAWSPASNINIRGRQQQQRQPTTPQRRFSPRKKNDGSESSFSATAQDQEGSFSRTDLEGVNGDEAASASGIIPAAQTGASQLAAAFTALDESDQYDAVLTGLCAKILDNQNKKSNEAGGGGGDNNAAALQDPAALLTEMNQRRIPASPRSLMALIDVRVQKIGTSQAGD